ncbi:cupin domain-containing protein [Paenibacillus sp. GCM10027626]|uniref:cupin domain-containing protein n=1 Tax=Paenibacillus sp. GCM10027626 TaxID=3273411 RepID=UPI003627854C
MSVSYMDFTSPSVQFSYDLSHNPFFKKDNRNYINSLSVNQLNTLGNYSLLDIYLSIGNVIEPHIHQNASELVYCISGAATVSIINPFTKELLNFPITPGQVANVPQGWWHYEIATADDTHLLAIFDAQVPEFIAASDMLRLTPASILAHTYCLDEAMVKETLAPITSTVVIGPPSGCKHSASREYTAPAAAVEPAAPEADVASPYAYPNLSPYRSNRDYSFSYPKRPPIIGNINYYWPFRGF